MALHADPYLPRLHFQGRPWMNDPIPFFHNGDYHVFYQHNPLKADWGEMHWGHAVSRDLLHWQNLPVALAPTPGTCDFRGCWTGSLIFARGGIHLFYTAIAGFQPKLLQAQALATTRDLITFEKYRGNPVIYGPPAGNGTCFRDPCVWQEAERFLMVIGGEKPDGSGGQALLYTSPDLLRWTYDGVFAEGRTAESGHDFECPDYFSLPAPDGTTTHVMLSSRNRQWAHTGARSGDRFLPHSVLPIEGPSFYAGKTVADDRGRRLLFGWILEIASGPGAKTGDEVLQRGWAGVLSFPRELFIAPAGQLGQRPVAELAAARRRTLVSTGPVRLGPGKTVLPGVRGDCIELRLLLKVSAQTRSVTLHLRHGPGNDGAIVAYHPGRGTLDDVPCPLSPDGAEGLVELRAFVDKSVVEVFALGAARTLRTYPASPEQAVEVCLESDGGVEVVELAAWDLTPD